MPTARVSPTGAAPDAAAPDAGAALVALATSRPGAARATAERLLAGRPDPRATTFALHALGVVHRDAGEHAVALRHLRRALQVAERAGLDDRIADVGATYGTVLAYAGKADSALRVFEGALSRCRGVEAARVLFRRGAALYALGRYAEAGEDLTRAAEQLRRAGDSLWEARAIDLRALALLERGEVERARRDLERTRGLYAALGMEFGAATALHNLGDALYRGGDIPAALARLDEAEQAYAAVGADIPELAMDRCAVLSAAGLATEAQQAAEHAVDLLTRERGVGNRAAQALLSAANAALRAGDPAAAIRYADRAQRAYRRGGHDVGAALACLAALRAVVERGRADRRHVARAADVVTTLSAGRSPDLHDAELVAARVALLAGDHARTELWLAAAASGRTRGPALRRTTGWLAAALQAQRSGDRRAMLRCCERGLALLDAHRASLGATELRAAATAHGQELAGLAVSTVAREGSARRLLAWSERWRATLHADTVERAPHDPDVLAALAALRRLTREIATTGSTADLERQRRRLEDAIRRRTRALPGQPGHPGQPGQARPGRAGFAVPDLLAALGADTTLVSVMGTEGRWHVVVASHDRVRRHVAGDIVSTRREVDYARFGLRAAAVRRGRSAAALFGSLEAALPRIEAALLGPARDDLGDGPVVLVPPARLHSAPWGALPALRERTVTVAPSATAWLRARSTPAPQGRVTLIAGPDLASAAAEVPALTELYDGAEVLDARSATVERVLAALDGAALAHVAAHGTFRGDNPMFSALQLADGPVTVYDLERLRRAPYRLVLSACESGVGAPTGADELLGLASSLVALGTAGVLASVVPVNDEATVPFSLAVHAALREGASLGEALRRARIAAGADPLARATAWSFLALGAA